MSDFRHRAPRCKPGHKKTMITMLGSVVLPQGTEGVEMAAAAANSAYRPTLGVASRNV
eukprot:CAMPEP_0194750024 /NCGR_PEP_ID=MMETSP0323_2-20130528/4057_1 /TAXON_ID=2866 ORGANISM="Crypthecodinium cohnii, Strain Seligo" /NCGR_SAMPLE_ID=MMETSP0323_2 /ASSEMBLY_ACC=CAM_ASM_000346 /LENGTH=57 /DNA_ID=CAMNT_0039665389 /DNA_START=15 /DNA_END=188 /DNA_ORIENTATION=-